MPCGTDQFYYAFYPRYFFTARTATEIAITPVKKLSARAIIKPSSFIVPPLVLLDGSLVLPCLY